MPYIQRAYVVIPIALCLLLAPAPAWADAAPPGLQATIVSMAEDHVVLLVHAAGGKPQTVRIDAAEFAGAETLPGKMRLRTRRGAEYDVVLNPAATRPTKEGSKSRQSQLADPSLEKLDNVISLAKQARTEYETLRRQHEKRMHAFLKAMEEYRAEVGHTDKRGVLNTHVHRLRGAADKVERSLAVTSGTLDELEVKLARARIEQPSREEATRIVALAKTLQKTDHELKLHWQQLSDLLEWTYKRLTH